MRLDRFCYMVTVINEVENETINRRTVTDFVNNMAGHESSHIEHCRQAVWKCGRCFCTKPLMRSFDVFGRVAVFFMNNPS